MSSTQILVSSTIPHEIGTSTLQKNGWFQDWGPDKPGATYDRKRNNSNKQWDLLQAQKLLLLTNSGQNLSKNLKNSNELLTTGKDVKNL